MVSRKSFEYMQSTNVTASSVFPLLHSQSRKIDDFGVDMEGTVDAMSEGEVGAPEITEMVVAVALLASISP